MPGAYVPEHVRHDFGRLGRSAAFGSYTRVSPRYSPVRRSFLIFRPAAESSISVANRRARVSPRMALTTHQMAVFRYPGGGLWKQAHACPFS